MTADEFIAWPGDGTGGRYQLVDGELRAMSPATATHGIIQGNLARLIGNHLDTPGGRCLVAAEPAIRVRLREKHNLRIPDLGVTCTPSHAGEVALSDPLLLIEVLSPGNAADTRENVWACTTIPSIKEILVVHSARVFAELLRRQVDGTWPKSPRKSAKPARCGWTRSISRCHSRQRMGRRIWGEARRAQISTAPENPRPLRPRP